MSRIIPIVIIVLLFTLILGGYFFWWPKYQEFRNKRLELETKDENIIQREEHLSELENFSDKLTEYKDELSKIDSALPADPSIAALFYFFLKASSENGLILTSHDLGRLYSLESSKERIQKMPFTISLSGSYPAFKNFLSTIYKNARLFEINSISFSSPEEEELFTFSLSLETHVFQEIEVKETGFPE